MQTKLITQNEYDEYAKDFNKIQKSLVKRLEALPDEKLLKAAKLLSYGWNDFKYLKSKKQFIKIIREDVNCKYYFENRQTLINYLADINSTIIINEATWSLIEN